MKGVQLRNYGGPEQFVLVDLPMPQPAAGEVLIKIDASAVNHFDVMVREGRAAQMIPLQLPAILGGDAAGTIAAIGPGAAAFSVGDRVIADFQTNGRGSHAEFGVVPVTAVAQLPGSVSFIDGAALPKAGLTARGAIQQLGIAAGDRVLVSGALGSVGRAALQHLREIGAYSVAAVRSERIEETRELADDVLDISRAPAARSFAYAISTAAPVSAKLFEHVRDGGKVFTVARAPDGLNADSRIAVLAGRHRTDGKVLQDVADAAGRGELLIPIANTFPLAQLADAHRAFAAGVRGKLVVQH